MKNKHVLNGNDYRVQSLISTEHYREDISITDGRADPIYRNVLLLKIQAKTYDHQKLTDLET